MTMKKRGFTLIELLVVIAIIGILVSVAIVNYITAQKQARDATRMNIMSNIQSAFEQYYAVNAQYPNIGSGTLDAAFDNNAKPTDPKNSGSYIINYNRTTTTAYCVCSLLEAKTGNANSPSSTTCSWNTTGTYYCIQNQQ